MRVKKSVLSNQQSPYFLHNIRSPRSLPWQQDEIIIDLKIICVYTKSIDDIWRR